MKHYNQYSMAGSLKFTGVYPSEWREIARRIKEETGNRCERCKHPHDPEAGYTLTVHHLDNNKANVQDWNLAALCQRCHLAIQGKVNIFQGYMFEVSDWFKPHLEGFLVSVIPAFSVIPAKAGIYKEFI